MILINASIQEKENYLQHYAYREHSVRAESQR